MAVSALFKSASNQRAKIQAANDAAIAFEWQNSAQTYDDYLAYTDYLQKARATTIDPTKSLSYDTKLRGAFSSYTSNEIQRQTQNIMTGRGTLQDKMNTVSSLYDQAVATGDYNLAQNLETTWNSLSVQSQNEAKAAASSSAANATANATAFKNSVNDLVDQYNNVLASATAAYTQSSNPQEWQQSLAKINQALPDDQKLPEGVDFFDIAASITKAIGGGAANGAPDPNSILGQAIQLAPDESTRKTIEGDFNRYIKGTVLQLPGVGGKSLSLTMDDLQRQVAAAQVGETIYRPIATADGTSWQENKVDNYVFGHDKDGNAVAIPTYSMNGTNTNQDVTDSNGKQIKVSANGKLENANYGKLLSAAGFDVKSEGGTITINDPSGKGRLNGSNTVQAFVDANGKLQYVDGNKQIYNFNFKDDGSFGGIYKETADPFLKTNMDGSLNQDSPYFANNPDQYWQTYGTAGLLTPTTVGQFDRSTSNSLNSIAMQGNGIINGPGRFSSASTLLQDAKGLQQPTLNAAQVQLQAPQIASAPMPQIQAPNITNSILNSRPNATVTVNTQPNKSTVAVNQPVKNQIKGDLKVSTSVPKFNLTVR